MTRSVSGDLGRYPGWILKGRRSVRERRPGRVCTACGLTRRTFAVPGPAGWKFKVKASAGLVLAEVPVLGCLQSVSSHGLLCMCLSESPLFIRTPVVWD